MRQSKPPDGAVSPEESTAWVDPVALVATPVEAVEVAVASRVGIWSEARSFLEWAFILWTEVVEAVQRAFFALMALWMSSISAAVSLTAWQW